MATEVYLPSPDVLWYERAKFEREMREAHWPDKVMASIMIHEMPSIPTAKLLIRRHGYQAALVKIAHMIDYFDEVKEEPEIVIAEDGTVTLPTVELVENYGV